MAPLDFGDDLQRMKNSLDSASVGDESGTLKTSIDDLKSSLHQMIDIFRKASDEMTLEEREERMLAKQIKPIFAKIEKIEEQNETIAEGMVTIAQKTEATQKKVEELEQRLAQSHLGQSSSSPQSYSPPSFHHDFSSDSNLPPLSGGPTPHAMSSSFMPSMPPSQPLMPLGGGAGSSRGMPPPPGNAIPPLSPNELEDNKKKGFNFFKK